MSLTLADGKTRAVVFTEPPTSLATDGPLTATEWNGATTIHDQVLKADFSIGATGSDTVNDAPLSSSGNATTFGASNYAGNATILRFLTPDGQPDPEDDHVWTLFRTKGTHLWIGVSDGKDPDADGASGDEYSLYHVVTDNPQRPSDRSGFIKHPVVLGVQRAWEYRALVTG